MTSISQVNTADRGPYTRTDIKHHTKQLLPLQQAPVAWRTKQLLVLQLSLVLRSIKAYPEDTIYC